MTVKHKNIGNDFDDFLKEEGIYEEVTAQAIKEVIADQVHRYMEEQHLTKTAMARQTQISLWPN